MKTDTILWLALLVIAVGPMIILAIKHELEHRETMKLISRGENLAIQQKEYYDKINEELKQKITNNN